MYKPVYSWRVTYQYADDLIDHYTCVAETEEEALRKAMEEESIGKEFTPVQRVERIDPWSLLLGKTIVSAQQVKQDDYSDEGFLELTFEDGGRAVIVASYGSHSEGGGKAKDEYPTKISIEGC